MPRVVLGVAGGIAAYKAVEVCRRLIDAGCFVSPVLTSDATRFIGRTTFDALGSEPSRVDLFGSPEPSPHTHLGQHADLIVIAPATANIVAKLAHGVSDDLLTATCLATRAPLLVCPAMHTEMWEQASVQANLATLRSRGVHVLEPDSGDLASGDYGMGRLPDPARIVEISLEILRDNRPLLGRRVLVTAGGTREPIDSVRVITNRSSGKQGYAIAEIAAAMGASVTLVTTVDRTIPDGITEVVQVETAAEMEAAVMVIAAAQDVIVMAAAVADFRPVAPRHRKTKKEDGMAQILLEPTHDFLVDLGVHKPPGQILVGFAAETESLFDNALGKLRRKNLDFIVGNDVSQPDAGFEVDTNRVVIIDAQSGVEELPLQSKIAVARELWIRIAAVLEPKSVL